MDWLRSHWPTIVAWPMGVAIAYGILTERVGDAEERLAKVEAQVETRAAAEDVKEIQKAVGRVQLDVGQLCAAQFGPEKCWTMGRGR